MQTIVSFTHSLHKAYFTLMIICFPKMFFLIEVFNITPFFFFFWGGGGGGGGAGGGQGVAILRQKTNYDKSL